MSLFIGCAGSLCLVCLVAKKKIITIFVTECLCYFIAELSLFPSKCVLVLGVGFVCVVCGSCLFAFVCCVVYFFFFWSYVFSCLHMVFPVHFGLDFHSCFLTYFRRVVCIVLVCVYQKERCLLLG